MYVIGYLTASLCQQENIGGKGKRDANRVSLLAFGKRSLLPRYKVLCPILECIVRFDTRDRFYSRRLVFPFLRCLHVFWHLRKHNTFLC